MQKPARAARHGDAADAVRGRPGGACLGAQKAGGARKYPRRPVRRREAEGDAAAGRRRPRGDRRAEHGGSLYGAHIPGDGDRDRLHPAGRPRIYRPARQMRRAGGGVRKADGGGSAAADRGRHGRGASRGIYAAVDGGGEQAFGLRGRDGRLVHGGAVSDRAALDDGGHGQTAPVLRRQRRHGGGGRAPVAGGGLPLRRARGRRAARRGAEGHPREQGRSGRVRRRGA